MGTSHLYLFSRVVFWGTGRRKGKRGLYRIESETYMNWTDWSFPFLRPVFSRRQTGAKIQIKLDKRTWVFRERKMGITGVPFGRTELSLRLSWTEFGALASRGGPEGPRVQGLPVGLFSTKKNLGRIWSCRALVKAILNRILRSIIWAWSQGSWIPGGRRPGWIFMFFEGAKNPRKK